MATENAAPGTGFGDDVKSLPSTLGGGSQRSALTYLTHSTMNSLNSMASGGGRNLVVQRTTVWDHERAQDEEYTTAWVPDEAASNCFVCDSAFGGWFGSGKHHCRACGNVVCNECSRARLDVQGLHGRQRVCDECVRRTMNGSENTKVKRPPRGGALQAIGEDEEVVVEGAAPAAELPPLARAAHLLMRMEAGEAEQIASIPPAAVRSSALLAAIIRAARVADGHEDLPSRDQGVLDACAACLPSCDWGDVPVMMRVNHRVVWQKVLEFVETKARALTAKGADLRELLPALLVSLPQIVREAALAPQAASAAVDALSELLSRVAFALPVRFGVPLYWSLCVEIEQEAEDGAPPARLLRLRERLLREDGALARELGPQQALWGRRSALATTAGTQLQLVGALLKCPEFFEEDGGGCGRTVVAPFGVRATGMLPSRAKILRRAGDGADDAAEDDEGGRLPPLVVEFEQREDEAAAEDLGAVGYQLLVRRSGPLLADMLVCRVSALFEALWRRHAAFDARLARHHVAATHLSGGVVEVVPECVTVGRLEVLAAQLNARPGTGVAHYLRAHSARADAGGADGAGAKAGAGLFGWGAGASGGGARPAWQVPGTPAFAFDTFARSCAAWTVLLHVLGVQELKSQNLLVTRRGSLFAMSLPLLLEDAREAARLQLEGAALAEGNMNLVGSDGAVHERHLEAMDAQQEAAARAAQAANAVRLRPHKMLSALAKELAAAAGDGSIFDRYVSYAVECFKVVRDALPELVNCVLTHPWSAGRDAPALADALCGRLFLDPRLASTEDAQGRMLAARFFKHLLVRSATKGLTPHAQALLDGTYSRSPPPRAAPQRPLGLGAASAKPPPRPTRAADGAASSKPPQPPPPPQPQRQPQTQPQTQPQPQPEDERAPDCAADEDSEEENEQPRAARGAGRPARAAKASELPARPTKDAARPLGESTGARLNRRAPAIVVGGGAVDAALRCREARQDPAPRRRGRGGDRRCEDCGGTYFSASGKTTLCVLCRTTGGKGHPKHPRRRGGASGKGAKGRYTVCEGCRGVYWSGSGTTRACARCRSAPHLLNARAMHPPTFSDSEEEED